MLLQQLVLAPAPTLLALVVVRAQPTILVYISRCTTTSDDYDYASSSSAYSSGAAAAATAGVAAATSSTGAITCDKRHLFHEAYIFDHNHNSFFENVENNSPRLLGFPAVLLCTSTRFKECHFLGNSNDCKENDNSSTDQTCFAGSA